MGKPDLLEFVLKLEYEHFRIPVANAHIVLDMNPENASENVGKKGYREYLGDRKDVYEEIPSLQERARLKYLEYAERMEGVRIIPCMENSKLKSIEAIGLLIDHEVDDILL